MAIPVAAAVSIFTAVLNALPTLVAGAQMLFGRGTGPRKRAFILSGIEDMAGEKWEKMRPCVEEALEEEVRAFKAVKDIVGTIQRGIADLKPSD